MKYRNKKKKKVHSSAHKPLHTRTRTRPALSQLTTGEKRRGEGGGVCANTQSPVLRLPAAATHLGGETQKTAGRFSSPPARCHPLRHARRPWRPQHTHRRLSFQPQGSPGQGARCCAGTLQRQGGGGDRNSHALVVERQPVPPAGAQQRGQGGEENAATVHAHPLLSPRAEKTKKEEEEQMRSRP